MNALLTALVNGAIPAAAITAAVWLVLRVIPRRMLNAATRYVLWWTTLAITITLPALYFPVQQTEPVEPPLIETPLLPPIQQAHEPAHSDAPLLHTPPPPATRIDPPRSQTVHFAWPSFPMKVSASRWPQWLLAGWSLVTLVLLIRLAASCVLLARLRARAFDVPAPLRARTETWLARRGGNRRGIRLAGSNEISIPVAVGPRRPSILIPARLLNELEERELEQLVLHEAAHLSRADDYALVAQRILEALFALHPVVLWIVRRIDLEREMACDDLVVAATGQARSYAACLTRIVELSGGIRSSLAAATAADDTTHLARRIDTLLDKTRHSGTKLLKARLTAMLAAIGVIAWMAAKTPGFVAFATPFAPSKWQVSIPQRLPHFAMLPQVAQAAQQQIQDPEDRVVEDSSGNPLVSAELRFHQAGLRELAADLDTDREGRFRAPGLAPGDYTVDVSKPNYITTTFKLHVPSASQMVRLIRYGVIDGQVTDSGGHPLPGRIMGPNGRMLGSARITVMVKRPGADDLQIFRQTPLGEDGRYRVYDLPPGQYAVGLWYSVLNDGSGMQLYPDIAKPRFFAVSGGEEYRDVNFSIVPRPTYQVSGKIELPKTKVQFQIALGLLDQPALPIAQTLTADDGSFHFEKVPSGTYDLFVAGPTGGYTAFESTLGREEPLFGRTRVQVMDRNVAGLDVALRPGRSVNVVLRARGSATPPEGCPQSAAVTLTSLEPWGVRFGANGQAAFGKEQTIRNLAPGRFRLTTDRLGAGCYQVNQPVVDLNGDVAAPVAVELAAAGSIRGMLKAGSAVLLLDAENADGAQAQVALSDSQGRFVFEGLRPGRYRIGAQSAGRSNLMEIEVSGGTRTTVELPAKAEGARP